MYLNSTNQQTFGAKLNIENLKFKEFKSLGGKKRWAEIKNLFQNQTKNDKNSYILESHRNHQGLSTIEMFKMDENSKNHIYGFGGTNYNKLVSLTNDEIAGKLISLIG